MGPVRKVEAGHIHACHRQRPQAFGCSTGRSNGADDLGASGEHESLLKIADAVHGVLDRVAVIEGGEAEIAFAGGAKAGARGADDVGLLQ